MNNLKLAFPPVSTPDSRILILGTMPGERSLKLQQYYGHAGNHFWKIMFSLFNRQFTKDYRLRQQLLLDNRIALWDVLQSCECEGSSDMNIRNAEANNFADFYSRHPHIQAVFFASKKAEEFYIKNVGKSSEYRYFTLPSPSSANTWKTFDQKVTEWKIILDELAC